jgi:RNA methyltransferase, TrmH family
MTIFTSRNNPKIKQIRSLKRSHRTGAKLDLFVVEGIRHVGEAVEAEAPIEYLVYAPGRLTSDFGRELVRQQEQRGLPCLAVEEDVFAGIADKESPQGLLAVVRCVPFSLEEISPVNAGWVVALVAPQDPGNIGAILRTMDAVGAKALLILDQGADPYHNTAVRASMGALFWIPVVQAAFNDFLRWSKHHRYHLYGTSAHGSEDYKSVPAYRKPAILLLGSERQGLTGAQAVHCERLIRLPMVGRTTSLNLAVAAGVMLYDMLGNFSEQEQM